jgi:hypothetical protein
MDIETRVNELIAEGHAEHSARVIADLESMNRATIDVAVHAVRSAITELGDDCYVDDRQLQHRRGRLHDCLSTFLTLNIGSGCGGVMGDEGASWKLVSSNLNSTSRAHLSTWSVCPA